MFCDSRVGAQVCRKAGSDSSSLTAASIRPGWRIYQRYLHYWTWWILVLNLHIFQQAECPHWHPEPTPVQMQLHGSNTGQALLWKYVVQPFPPGKSQLNVDQLWATFRYDTFQFQFPSRRTSQGSWYSPKPSSKEVVKIPKISCLEKTITWKEKHCAQKI